MLIYACARELFVLFYPTPAALDGFTYYTRWTADQIRVCVLSNNEPYPRLRPARSDNHIFAFSLFLLGRSQDPSSIE